MIICDKCKKELKDDKGFILTLEDNKGSQCFTKQVHLCDTCKTKIGDFLEQAFNNNIDENKKLEEKRKQEALASIAATIELAETINKGSRSLF